MTNEQENSVIYKIDNKVVFTQAELEELIKHCYEENHVIYEETRFGTPIVIIIKFKDRYFSIERQNLLFGNFGIYYQPKIVRNPVHTIGTLEIEHGICRKHKYNELEEVKKK